MVVEEAGGDMLLARLLHCGLLTTESPSQPSLHALQNLSSVSVARENHYCPGSKAVAKGVGYGAIYRGSCGEGHASLQARHGEARSPRRHNLAEPTQQNL